MQAWFKLSNTQKRAIITNTANQKGLSEQVVEKDLWVTIVLDALFGIPGVGEHLVFKGGTSLSKGYDLIGRFSEDIDFAIDRSLLGFGGEQLSKTQITKLRRASHAFAKETLVAKLSQRLYEIGVPEKECKVYCAEAPADSDPLPVYVEYAPVAGTPVYIADKVILEISARSLMEPAEKRPMISFIAEVYPERDFIAAPFEVSTVLPARTLLEKVFLLHELFLHDSGQPPRNHMSRHLYDIEKLMDTPHAAHALAGGELFMHIAAHRKAVTPIRGITYDKHTPAEVNMIPPAGVISLWEKDYEQFAAYMVKGKVLSFPELMTRLTTFQRRIRTMS